VIDVRSRVFVDTNLLVYHRDSRDAEKQRRAAEWMAYLWQTRSGRVSTQVLQEYYVTVTDKLDPGLSSEDARDDVQALGAWAPVESGLDLIEAAWQEQDRWGFSFWDSLIVAAARAQACSVLLSEDLSHGQDLDGLRVVNPFAEAPPTR
jgi:predicted nucleic acid-binding protein